MGSGKSEAVFNPTRSVGSRRAETLSALRPHWAAFPTVKKAMRRRLRALGLWSHIHAVAGPLAEGARGASFISHNNEALLKDLINSGHFGRDRHVGRIFHTEGVSLRELRVGSGLHLVLKVGNRVEVHIDRACPALATKAGGWCCYQPRRVAAHFRHDVLPLILPRLRRQSGRGATAVGKNRSRPRVGTLTTSITVCATKSDASLLLHHRWLLFGRCWVTWRAHYSPVGSGPILADQPELARSSPLPPWGNWRSYWLRAVAEAPRNERRTNVEGGCHV